MKKSLIAAGIFALLASTGAKAADIVSYQAPEAAAPAAPAQVNWNGFYIGGTIGGSWANGRNKVVNDWHLRSVFNGKEYNESEKTKLFNKKVNPNSFIGGIYAGYNFQPGFLSNSMLKDVVFGLDTDWLWNSGGKTAKGVSDLVSYDVKDDHYGDGGDGDYTGEKAAYKTRLRQKWNGSTRLRAGYALGSEGRFMPYIAGGVSYTEIESKFRAVEIEEDNDGDFWRGSKSKTRAGWNIGAGIDYVPPILNDHLVLRAEYRFTDFGTMKLKQKYVTDYDNDDTHGEQDYGSGTMSQKVKFNQNDFRVGIAYKF